MVVQKDEAIELLNRLIEICTDGEKGFTTAAGEIKQPDLRDLLTSYSSQRALFAHELKTEVQKLGGTPQANGSLGGAVHRGWMNLKALVGSPDECSIVGECERGEDIALKAYDEAINRGLSPDVLAIVTRQRKQVKEAHDRIHALELACSKK